MCRPRDPQHYDWCDKLPLQKVRPSNAQVPVLRPAAEKRVDDALKDFSYRMCDAVVRPFTQCTRTQGFSALWRCQKLRRDMVQCMEPYWIDEYRDVYRRAYARRYPKAPVSWREPVYIVEDGVADGRTAAAERADAINTAPMPT